MSTLRWLFSIGQLITLALAVFPAPSNVTMTSENFQHILTWSPGNSSCTPPLYKVKYLNIRRNRKWVFPDHCSNTSYRSCDLTNELKDEHGSYLVQVQCVTSVGNDSEESKIQFDPHTSTVLGPPAVHITASTSSINITLQSPVSYLKSKDRIKMGSLIDVYHLLNYIITLEGPELREEITKEAHEENFTTVVDHLLPNANYCISVVTSATSNLNPLRKSSALKCIVTYSSSSTTGATVYAVIFGVLFSLGVFLVLAGLYLSGFISPSTIHLQNVLTISKTENPFVKCLPEQVCPVEIPSIRKKKKVLDCSSDEDESDEEAVHEDYTCRFDINTKLPIDASTSDITTSHTFTDSSVVDISSHETPCTEAAESDEIQSLAEDDSGTSKLLTPLVSRKGLSAHLDNSGNFNVNLASVLLGVSERPSNNDLVSQTSPPDDQESSTSSQDSSAPLLAFELLMDKVGVQMAELSEDLEDCFSNETLDTDESDDTEENQVSGYMRR